MSKKLASLWQFVKPYLFVIIIIAIAIGALELIWIISPGWSGFGKKTLWDWLNLLIVPIFLVVAAVWFEHQEKKTERENARQREEADLKLENERRQDDLLQAYLDKMTDLMLEKSLSTRESTAEIRYIARARTLTALRGLNGVRKAILLQFIYESGLINVDLPIIDMRGADLNQVKLQETAYFVEFQSSEFHATGVGVPKGANMSNIALYEANLRKADLGFVDFKNANLSKSDFYKANLMGAKLQSANLQKAHLNEARLDWIDLENANLNSARLRDANLTRANLRNSDLRKASLCRADLRDADLRHANLQGADLEEAYLRAVRRDPYEDEFEDAVLEDANLSETNLKNAEITLEQLTQANSLFGATLPNGSRYDGRFNLSGDIELARSQGIDVKDSHVLMLWYANDKA